MLNWGARLGGLQTVLLALHHTGVAREVAGLLELAAVVASSQQRTGDAVTQRAGLTEMPPPLSVAMTSK